MTLFGHHACDSTQYPRGWRQDLQPCEVCVMADGFCDDSQPLVFGSLHRQVSLYEDRTARGQSDSRDACNDDVEIVLEEKKLSMWFVPPSKKWQREKAAQLHIAAPQPVAYGSPQLMWRSQKPSKTVKTIGDGNCFFRSLSYVLTGSHELHLTLRAIIVQVILECPKLFQNLTSVKPHQYIKESNMAVDKTWASEVEIFAAATLLKTPIAIFARYGAKDEWLIYKPLEDDSRKEYGEKDTMIYLSNLCSHFEPVLDV